jgi:hypothetical protein
MGLFHKRAVRKCAAGEVFYALNEEPQPQVDLTLGLSNLKPAASNVST